MESFMNKNLRICALSLSLLASTALVLTSTGWGMQNPPPLQDAPGQQQAAGQQPQQDILSNLTPQERQEVLEQLVGLLRSGPSGNPFNEREYEQYLEQEWKLQQEELRNARKETSDSFFNSLNNNEFQPFGSYSQLPQASRALPNLENMRFREPLEAYNHIRTVRNIQTLISKKDNKKMSVTILPSNFKLLIEGIENSSGKINGVADIQPISYLESVLNPLNLLEVQGHFFAKNVLRILKSPFEKYLT